MRAARKKEVLDAWAMLAYLQGEPEGAVVRELLKQADAGEIELLMSVINLGEVYYRLRRDLGQTTADEQLATIRLLPVTYIGVSEKLVFNAAVLKADYALPYVDCFAAATAIAEDATVITGDPDFKKVEDAVQVHWL